MKKSKAVTRKCLRCQNKYTLPLDAKRRFLAEHPDPKNQPAYFGMCQLCDWYHKNPPVARCPCGKYFQLSPRHPDFKDCLEMFQMQIIETRFGCRTCCRQTSYDLYLVPQDPKTLTLYRKNSKYVFDATIPEGMKL